MIPITCTRRHCREPDLKGPHICDACVYNSAARADATAGWVRVGETVARIPAPAPVVRKQCRTCRCYADDGTPLTPTGTCRCLPPAPNAGWPGVRATDWCDWWEAREPAPSTGTPSALPNDWVIRTG